MQNYGDREKDINSIVTMSTNFYNELYKKNTHDTEGCI